VQSIKTLLVLLLALVWAPMTAHCNIESVPGFSFLTCETDVAHETSPKHCGTECCVLESSPYRSDDSKPVSAPIAVAAILCQLELIDLQQAAQHVPDLRLLTVPPELPKSWQFIARTALPVRAPSIAS
jgi:hypothetical protein